MGHTRVASVLRGLVIRVSGRGAITSSQIGSLWGLDIFAGSRGSSGVSGAGTLGFWGSPRALAADMERTWRSRLKLPEIGSRDTGDLFRVLEFRRTRSPVADTRLLEVSHLMGFLAAYTRAQVRDAGSLCLALEIEIGLPGGTRGWDQGVSDGSRTLVGFQGIICRGIGWVSLGAKYVSWIRSWGPWLSDSPSRYLVGVAFFVVARFLLVSTLSAFLARVSARDSAPALMRGVSQALLGLTGHRGPLCALFPGSPRLTRLESMKGSEAVLRNLDAHLVLGSVLGSPRVSGLTCCSLVSYVGFLVSSRGGECSPWILFPLGREKHHLEELSGAQVSPVKSLRVLGAQNALRSVKSLGFGEYQSYISGSSYRVRVRGLQSYVPFQGCEDLGIQGLNEIVEQMPRGATDLRALNQRLNVLVQIWLSVSAGWSARLSSGFSSRASEAPRPGDRVSCFVFPRLLSHWVSKRHGLPVLLNRLRFRCATGASSWGPLKCRSSNRYTDTIGGSGPSVLKSSGPGYSSREFSVSSLYSPPKGFRSCQKAGSPEKSLVVRLKATRVCLQGLGLVCPVRVPTGARRVFGSPSTPYFLRVDEPLEVIGEGCEVGILRSEVCGPGSRISSLKSSCSLSRPRALGVFRDKRHKGHAESSSVHNCSDLQGKSQGSLSDRRGSRSSVLVSILSVLGLGVDFSGPNPRLSGFHSVHRVARNPKSLKSQIPRGEIRCKFSGFRSDSNRLLTGGSEDRGRGYGVTRKRILAKRRSLHLYGIWGGGAQEDHPSPYAPGSSGLKVEGRVSVYHGFQGYGVSNGVLRKGMRGSVLFRLSQPCFLLGPFLGADKSIGVPRIIEIIGPEALPNPSSHEMLRTLSSYASPCINKLNASLRLGAKAAGSQGLSMRGTSRVRGHSGLLSSPMRATARTGLPDPF
nr:hypothetical protein Iba_chr10fCG0010 [Ipomoea batatas]